MKRLIHSTLVFAMMLAVANAAAPDKNEIIVRENAVWRAVQQKKVEQFKQLVSPDVRAVYADGIMTMPDELKAIPKSAMKSNSLSDFKVVFPDEKTAVVAYLAKVVARADGKEITTAYNAGSVWQLSKGKWQAIFHGEAKQVPAQSPPPASTPAGAPQPQGAH
jgi:hypothetical protein